MTSAKIVLIIVNWKLKHQTARCLQSLAQVSEPHRVIVVDNGSHDGSVEYLQALFSDLSVIPLSENLGFGAACNRALKSLLLEPDWEYVFLVNNDALLHPEALTYLRQAAQQSPQVGIFGPKIYYETAPDRIWYAGARRRWGVLAATGTGRGQLDQGQFDQRQNIDFVFGAGMFIRRQVIETIGFFDEQFFIYLEDLDYCLRAQKAGFSLQFVPQARLWHRVSASTESLPDWRKYHQARSTILFLLKHTTFPLALPVIAFWMLVFLRSVFAETLQGNLNSSWIYLSGLINAILLEKAKH